MRQNEGAQRQLQHAVVGVVQAAVQWAAADYGDVDQLRADAALADAVKEYQRVRAKIPSPAGLVLRPDRLDV